MRNQSLHAALRDFALEASSALTHAVEGGDELGYDVAEEPGSGPVLYRYRALTAEYIGSHWGELAQLPSLGRAASELGAGAATWLRSHGMPGAEAEPALRAMLERLFEDATSFDFPEERFERVYAELERTLYDGTMRVAAVAPLRSARIESRRVDLGGGVALVRGDAADAPREAVWPHPHLVGESPEPNVLIVIDREADDGRDLPLERFRARVGDIVRGLRLWAPGALAPGGGGWVRSDHGPWQYFDLEPFGPGRGEPWTLLESEETELREFLRAIEDARVPGRIAWALDRFELGCERTRDSEALSDFLMALRALLDANDEAGRASLSLRLAALCAEEPDRRAVQRRTELAFALERFLVGGGSAESYVDEVGAESPAVVTAEVEGCVRALLRDILCGYLDADLRRTADDILLTSGAPVEIEARDLRADRAPGDDAEIEARDLRPEHASDDEIEAEAWGPPETRAERASDAVPDPQPLRVETEPRERSAAERAEPRESRARTSEDRAESLGAKPRRQPTPKARKAKPRARVAQPELRELETPELADGVTPSADWGFDDADCYSAPV